MAGPKVTVIGAGSYFFGKEVIYKMATSPVLAGGTLALVDTQPDVLATMMRLAERIFAHTRCGANVVGSTDRRAVLAGSDFVIFTFSERNAYFRGVDTQIAARHGIRMCSSDTIGPGGIFRALREVPHALAMARDVQALAPHAWVVNLVNPTAVLGMALRRYAPEVRSFALCDGQHEPHNTLRWCKTLGILPDSATAIPPEVLSRLDLVSAGVNHCTWILRCHYDGQDLMPRLREHVAALAREEMANPDDHSKRRYNATYALQLFDLYGAYPTAVGHTKEYVPFYQGYGVAPVEPEPIQLFDAGRRMDEMAAAWRVTQAYAAGERGAEDFLQHGKSDHASDIIEAMWSAAGQTFYINTRNGGAVTNLPPDAVLELRCDVDLRGPRPHAVGAMPLGLRALQFQILDTHELTAAAAVSGDRATLRRAMLTDPICNNIGDADHCIADLLEAERDVLPSYWYR